MTDRPAGDHSLLEEQERVDVVYARLDELRALTTDRLAQVRRAGPSGSPQNRSERDAFATLYEDRLAQLNAVEERLVFGRLDLEAAESRYIGRIGISDAEHTNLLTDWRAPAARPFYQATGAKRDGVVRRRHLLTRGRRVTAVEDEVLDAGLLQSEPATALVGEGALLASLRAPRTGRMSDIVATIQSEQDAVIRADLAGTLVVQGGPGTGKTAVALHRAAFLLYAHRDKLERSGVLLIGPSRAFLSYIERVLPSLGETGVVATTVAELIPGLNATAAEPEEVAAVKGRAVMARVVARAVRGRQRVPLEPKPIQVGSHRLLLKPSTVVEAQGRARRASRQHNRARVTFVQAALTALAHQYAETIGASRSDIPDLAEEIRTTRDARIALNLAWMPLTPQGLLEDLYARPDRLEAAAPELSEAERALLARDRGAPWTPADVPLLDEAAELIGDDETAQRAQARADAARREEEVAFAREALRNSGASGLVSAEMLAARFTEPSVWGTTAERAAADRRWTYGHVVVDEAQELSPMAWRAVLRRIPTRSMTVVGDLAQASPGGVKSWGAALDRPLGGSWHLAELTVNYRTPASVMELAATVAAELGHPSSPVRSVRDVPGAIRFSRPLPADRGGVPAAAVRAVTAELGEAERGTTAVICSRSRRDEIHAALHTAATDNPALAEALRSRLGDSLTARVAVLDPQGSKGLEFDSVILVEPEDILQGPARRASDLYVAMTRTTNRLHVVAAGQLPAALSRISESEPSL